MRELGEGDHPPTSLYCSMPPIVDQSVSHLMAMFNRQRTIHSQHSDLQSWHISDA